MSIKHPTLVASQCDCSYDSQGQRHFKKVTVAGTMTLHHRYIYRGYLQIAALDLARSTHPALWLVTWDPSQPTATRPLAIQKDGTWFTYGYDITKNICEVFGQHGYIRTAYSYAPFGSVSASENGVSQPFQWSSEHYDDELGLVYYNYRHYSSSLGRFLSRDPIQEQGGWNLYAFVKNNPSVREDCLGRGYINDILMNQYIVNAIHGIFPLPTLKAKRSLFIEDIWGEMTEATPPSMLFYLNKYLSQHERTPGFHKEYVSRVNVAAMDQMKAIRVRNIYDLEQTVGSSSNVFVSGEVSYCVSKSGDVTNVHGNVFVVWEDIMDANSFWESYKRTREEIHWQTALLLIREGIIDIIGDKLLGADFDFVIKYPLKF